MQQLTLDWNSPVHEGAGASAVPAIPIAPAATPDAAKAGQELTQTLPPASAAWPDEGEVADAATAITATTAPVVDVTPAAPLLVPQTHAGAADATNSPSNGPEVATASPVVATPVATPAWQHPQANRHIVLGQHALGYWLQRRKRRSVGMKIASQGLEVHAPVWVNLAEIERILHSKSGWIVRKLQEQAHLQHSQQLARPQWQDAQYLPWRGGLLQLRLAGAATPTAAARLSAARMQKLAQAARLQAVAASSPNAALASGAAATACMASHQLWLDLPANSPEGLIRDCTACWMQMQAQAVFAERMAHYAPLLGVQWRALKLSQANTRWGSASSNGTIRLHWRLMQMPPEVLDYVVVHELAHLREMNHSARFWALVEQILPDYRQRQFQLKRTTLPPWLASKEKKPRKGALKKRL